MKKPLAHRVTVPPTGIPLRAGEAIAAIQDLRELDAAKACHREERRRLHLDHDAPFALPPRHPRARLDTLRRWSRSCRGRNRDCSPAVLPRPPRARAVLVLLRAPAPGSDRTSPRRESPRSVRRYARRLWIRQGLRCRRRRRTYGIRARSCAPDAPPRWKHRLRDERWRAVDLHNPARRPGSRLLRSRHCARVAPGTTTSSAMTSWKKHSTQCSATSMALMTRLGSMIAMRARSRSSSGTREFVESLPARPCESELPVRRGFVSRCKLLLVLLLALSATNRLLV